MTVTEAVVPEGSWVAVATVSGLEGPGVFAGDPQQFGFVCELHDINDQFMGGAVAVGESSPNITDVHSLTVIGGTFAAAGETQFIRLVCKMGLPGQDAVGAFGGGNMVVMQIGGFF